MKKLVAAVVQGLLLTPEYYYLLAKLIVRQGLGDAFRSAFGANEKMMNSFDWDDLSLDMATLVKSGQFAKAVDLYGQTVLDFQNKQMANMRDAAC